MLHSVGLLLIALERCHLNVHCSRGLNVLNRVIDNVAIDCAASPGPDGPNPPRGEQRKNSRRDYAMYIFFARRPNAGETAPAVPRGAGGAGVRPLARARRKKGRGHAAGGARRGEREGRFARKDRLQRAARRENASNGGKTPPTARQDSLATPATHGRPAAAARCARPELAPPTGGSGTRSCSAREVSLTLASSPSRRRM